LITYCSNIHPGESWADTFANLLKYIPQVKSAVSPNAAFPIGLRLSSQAAAEVDEKTTAQLLGWCQQEDCYIASINAFPYGQFHNSVIKEQVYLPDWRSYKRVNYSLQVGRLLSRLLPTGYLGAISTVPIAFKSKFNEADLPLVRQNLISLLEGYDSLRQQSGRQLCLALEPEPGCLLETTEEVCRFFEWLKLPASLKGCLGICFDCCHQAVEFENPIASLQMLAGAEVPIAKVQISSAPRFVGPQLQDLQPFIDPCYLHQVVIKDEGSHLSRYSDLPAALEDYQRFVAAEWRVHYHIPIFLSETDGMLTTRNFIEELLLGLQGTELLEIETYTWEVLPEIMRLPNVVDSVIREIKWLQERVNAKNRCA